VELAERRDGTIEDFVRDFDAAMKATADRALPEPLRAALDGFERRVDAEAETVREAAAEFDPALARATEDALRRAREAVEKLRGKAADAARAAEQRRDPAVKNYREFLRPRGVPQERVLSALVLFLDSAEHPLDRLDAALAKHLDAVRDGQALHWLVELGA
jgi:hypothetical protein